MRDEFFTRASEGLPARLSSGAPLALACAALLLASCGRSSPGEARAVQGDPIDFGLGFSPEERAADGQTWRWMGPEGIVRLRNSHRAMVLTITGRFPSQVAQPTAVEVEFNHEPLDPLPATAGDTSKRYAIPAEKQGDAEWSRLLLTARVFFVPHQLDLRSPDQRELAFAVVSLRWDPQP